MIHHPAFNEPPIYQILQDQYAFRPSESTTAAIISILHHVRDLLKTNTYATLISLDFSKTFDMVRYATLAEKLPN